MKRGRPKGVKDWSGGAIVPDPEEAGLGPAMQALNAGQRRFVLAMVETPGITQGEAARAAGYSAVSPGSLRVQGHMLAHDEAVLAAIHEVASKRLRSNSLLASDVLVQIMSDNDAPTKDRLKAAGMLLDRTGFAAVQTINVNKTVSDTTDRGVEARLLRAAERLAKLGLDPNKLLGRPAVVEGEFSEVEK